MANKGGQVVKFSINGTSLCFVSSHLAAHEGGKHLKDRNASVAEIFHGARIGRKALDLGSQFHHCFFMGDMNYRVDISTLDEHKGLSLKGLEKPAKKAKRKEQWDIVKGWVDELDDASKREAALKNLLSADELSSALKNQDVLVGFQTSNPTFKPTFKVHRFKPLTYVDNRVPSYCDRILWKSLPGFTQTISPIPGSYEACGKYDASDHKPVRPCRALATALAPYALGCGSAPPGDGCSAGRSTACGRTSLVGVSTAPALTIARCELAFPGPARVRDQGWSGSPGGHVRRKPFQNLLVQH